MLRLLSPVVHHIGITTNLTPPSPNHHINKKNAPTMASIPLSDTSPFHDGPDSPIPQLPTPTATRWPRRRIILLASLTKCLVVFSGMLMLIPLYRLIEDALCRAHFDTTLPVDEMECKVDAVQSRLAYLLGWMTLLNSAIAFLVAYPYGMLSDRIGRRPVLVLSYAGLVASFFFGPLMLARGPGFVASNPGILFVGGLFQLVGGGVPVLLATLYSVAADVSSDKEKYTTPPPLLPPQLTANPGPRASSTLPSEAPSAGSSGPSSRAYSWSATAPGPPSASSCV